MTERDLHDMGGNIGPASLASSAGPEDGEGGYAQSVSATVGVDEQDPSIAGSDESGSAAVAPVANGRPDILAIDDVDNIGRGADGDTEARLQQREDGDI